jgi:hypothetical protein
MAFTTVSSTRAVTAQTTADPIAPAFTLPAEHNAYVASPAALVQWTEVHALYLPLIFTTSPPSCIPDPVGESSNVADAIKICSEQTVTGQVSEADRDDVYLISAAANQVIDIVLQGTGDDADLYLYPPGTLNVNSDPWVAQSENDGCAEEIHGTMLVGGDWFIDIYAYYGTTNYTLVVTLPITEVTSAQTSTTPIGIPIFGNRSSK